MTAEREGLAEMREVIRVAAEKYLSDFDTVMNVRSEARDLAVTIDRALADLLAARDRRVRAEAVRYFASSVGDRNERYGLTTEARHFGKTYARLARLMAAGIEEADDR